MICVSKRDHQREDWLFLCTCQVILNDCHRRRFWCIGWLIKVKVFLVAECWGWTHRSGSLRHEGGGNKVNRNQHTKKKRMFLGADLNITLLRREIRCTAKQTSTTHETHPVNAVNGHEQKFSLKEKLVFMHFPLRFLLMCHPVRCSVQMRGNIDRFLRR